jgi:DNA modification methylase
MTTRRRPTPRAEPSSPFTRDLRVDAASVAALKPHPHNARKHSKKQVQQIAESIRVFGFTNPVLIDDDNRIVAGHGRVAAAKLVGMAEVPTIRLSNLSEAEIRAYVIADNRLAEKAGWDRELVATELQYLSDLQIELDVTVTGFDLPEIDVLIEGLDGAGAIDEADRLPAFDEATPPVTRRGDLWKLGAHRIYCGNATAPDSFSRLLEGRRAPLVFTDPPYNVPIAGHVTGLGRIRHGEFAMACGEMSKAEFTAFLESVFALLAASSTDGAIHFICMDWRHMHEVLEAAQGLYAELKNVCVWNKTNGGMGSLYRSKHEMVFVFKNGTAPHTNNVELGRHGRYRSNVWDYAGVNTLGADRMAELSMHPTVKPVALVADAIRDCSRRGDIVLDCFGGSGTTLIAAERTGRRGYLMEMEPRYVDVAIERYRLITGQEAIHAETGLTPAQLTDWREVLGDEAEPSALASA